MAAENPPPPPPPPAHPNEPVPADQQPVQPANVNWFDRIKFKENIGLNVFVPKNIIGKRAPE